MAGDLNLFLSQNQMQWVETLHKRKSLAKLIELREASDLCDIWRMINAKVRRFIFTQQHTSGFIYHKLDCIFIFSGHQEFVSTTDILTPISIIVCKRVSTPPFQNQLPITWIPQFLKGYFRYKMITPQNALSKAQVKNFFISQFLCFQPSRDLGSLGRHDEYQCMRPWSYNTNRSNM